MHPVTVTLKSAAHIPDMPDNAFRVLCNATELAVVTFDGPRNTIITHSGHLYADERKAAYRAKDAVSDDI